MPPDARDEWPEEPLRLWDSLPEPDRRVVLSAVSPADVDGRPVAPHGIQRAIAAGAALTREVLGRDRARG
ncbi:hypothetical protein EAH89_08225 [Roseomonas nepalensis]|uniref:Uncharacterized protein n=1 Tax=Muricoccus nepalensis TaxID=1854500 RepID=A0A502GCZ5_9PROT|nr:hypothetical protein [Roseomonas nepalensis]TPG58583.1 hypothetical protein EAH89_08225 [Roseomonas nepalensis]